MKKPINFRKYNSESSTEAALNDKKIFEDLEISQRTQRPPTEELIAKLNQIASKPPFCYTHKIKKHYPR